MANAENAFIASLVEELAELLEREDPTKNKYRCSAYRKAAMVFRTDDRKLDSYDIREHSGVGDGIKGKVDEYYKVGKILDLERLREKYGVVAKTDKKGERIPWKDAFDKVEPILSMLGGLKEAVSSSMAGSLLRYKATVHDADIVVAVKNDEDRMVVKGAFMKMGKELSSGGDKRMSIEIDGFMVELMIVPENVYGAAMFHATGPAAYNVRNRQLAIENGWSLSQNGLVDAKTGEMVACKTEEEICEKLGIPWIDPQFREDYEKAEKTVVSF